MIAYDAIVDDSSIRYNSSSRNVITFTLVFREKKGQKLPISLKFVLFVQLFLCSARRLSLLNYH